MVTRGTNSYMDAEPVPIRQKRRPLPYKARPFVAWDGEGTASNDGTQNYSLFGCSEPGWEPLIAERLTTVQCLEYLCKAGEELRDRIHVSFGFNYDVDMILRDVPDADVAWLKPSPRDGEPLRTLTYAGYDVQWIPRKMFTVKRSDAKSGITIFETFSFFASSLMVAAEQYIKPEHPLYSTLQFVAAGKGQRNVFRYEETDTMILPYWRAENQLFVAMMELLRESTEAAGIQMTAWHGPGAIASSLYEQHRLAQHFKRTRNLWGSLDMATRCAFFGGHIECFTTGYVEGPIYTADIRSAYPAAMSKIPGLVGGHWKHVTGGDIDPWGLYRVTWNARESFADLTTATLQRGPLPYRESHGAIVYPLYGHGWYYGCEVQAAQLWNAAPLNLRVHEGWIYENSQAPNMFGWVADMYDKRAEAKRQGNPAQLAYKLGLNSLYGKLAQTSGWRKATEPGAPNRLPPYHHPYYAGAITSWCRAQLMRTMIATGLEHIIAVETDGIYSRKPLAVTDTPVLGGWEVGQYDAITYVQSGMYMYEQNGEIATRTRGFSKRSLPVDLVKSHLPDLSTFIATQRVYGSLTAANATVKRHTWDDITREVRWGGTGKRWHESRLCPTCLEGVPADKHWHPTFISPTAFQHQPDELSKPRFIPWKETAFAEPPQRLDPAWITDRDAGGHSE